VTSDPSNGILRAPGARRIPAQLWDASLEARRRLDAATLEARAVVERARGEAEAIRGRAAAQGREEGLACATDLVARAALVRDRLLAEAEPQLVELAFAVAGRVLERVVARDREAVADVAARALETVRQREEVRLRVHPEDAAALREAEPSLSGQLARARCIALVEDPSVGQGGVVVETEAGSVDARLVTQLEALRRALEEASGGEPRDAPGVAS
jgi:flagellar biosynthesis/type III secretory pathway protein FliH